MTGERKEGGAFVRAECIWLKRLSVPFLWAAGGLILAAMVLSHIAGLTVLANSFYLAAFVPSGVPVLLAGCTGALVH